ncbi:glycosyltransferase family 2 protein [Candidatus Avelusimicrobium caledoniensis]|uniref:glycosyltransferase family 2 protein n=1 Tax=Candidatus Avelusimicrobium caledoniensis TaxID=3416220 RepID=UPI003D0F6802
MTNSPLISVVVPIYNMAAYLPRCVDSILAQTYKNLEIILVDDGSTDNCLEICQQYAQKDNRIKVIHQENKGVSAARNAGLDNMHGDFVAFVDPDDWLAENAYEILIDLHQKTGADIAWGNIIFHYADGRPPKEQPLYFSSNTNWNHISQEDYLITLQPSCWNKLYIKRLFNKGVQFATQYTYGEDLDFMFHAVQAANFVAFTTAPVYHYLVRSNSVSNGPSISDVLQGMAIRQNILEFCAKNNLPRAHKRIQTDILSFTYTLFTILMIYDKKNQYLELLNKLRNWLLQHKKLISTTSVMTFFGKAFLLCTVPSPKITKKILRTSFINAALKKQFITRAPDWGRGIHERVARGEPL